MMQTEGPVNRQTIDTTQLTTYIPVYIEDVDTMIRFPTSRLGTVGTVLESRHSTWGWIGFDANQMNLLYIYFSTAILLDSKLKQNQSILSSP